MDSRIICCRADDTVPSHHAKQGGLETIEAMAEQLPADALTLRRPSKLVLLGNAEDRTETDVLKNMCGVWSVRPCSSIPLDARLIGQGCVHRAL
jgi:hypothetical protein